MMYKTYKKFSIKKHNNIYNLESVGYPKIKLIFFESQISFEDFHSLKNDTIFLEMESSFEDQTPKIYDGKCRMLSTSIKYFWFNPTKGTFSNSWDEVDHEKFIDEEVIVEANKNGSKLIKFECINDKDFEFYHRMKLK